VPRSLKMPRTYEADIEPEDIPVCPKMDGSTLKIVPAYTEAGWYTEANCITVTDGERTAIYVPLASVPSSRQGE